MKNMYSLEVIESTPLGNNYQLIKLTQKEKLPKIEPGQFVQILVENSKVLLRRPISINFVDHDKNEIWILIQIIGEGTKVLSQIKPGNYMNMILPLGKGFSTPNRASKVLLIGGGVGIAPLLYHGQQLKEKGHDVNYLLGFRTKNHIIQMGDFQKFGNLNITTEDGSYDVKGYVTDHAILSNHFDMIYTCGPKPMMYAVAKYAHSHNINCEVSLENMMACGFGACLCCVEKTIKGNVCACTEGPVFNLNELTWIN